MRGCGDAGENHKRKTTKILAFAFFGFYGSLFVFGRDVDRAYVSLKHLDGRVGQVVDPADADEAVRVRAVGVLCCE